MENHVKKIFEDLIQQPAFVTNQQNNLLYWNSKLVDELGLDDENKIEKAVIEFTSDPIYTSKITELLEQDIPVEFSLNIEDKSGRVSYNLVISQQNIESEDYIISQIRRSEEELGRNYKFSINYSDVQEYVKNNSLEEVINNVKSSFPFTFIGKQKFQREIDNLPIKFWIKTSDQKIIIANREFASSFGKDVSQIQGVSANDLYEELDLEALKSMENFLLNHAKPVIVDIFYSAENKSEIIVELPLIDIDNKIVAIVGFSDISGLTKSVPVSLENDVFLNLLKSIDKPFLMVDNELKIVNYNDQFSELFLKKSEDNTGLNISEVLTGELLQKINSFVESGRDKLDDYIKPGGGVNEKLHILFSKLYSDEDNLGYCICFDTNISNNKNDLKGKMYDIIMQSSPEPLFIYDIENLKFIEVNHSALALYGYTREEFLDMDLTDLYAPEDIQTLIESSPDKSTSSEFTGPWRHRHKNGSSILVEISKTSLEYQGKKAHFNIVRAVTESLEEKQLLQSYKSVYENSGDPVFKTDRDGFINSANSTALKLMNCEMKELMNKPFLSLVGDEDRVKVNAEVFHADHNISGSVDIKIKLPRGQLADAVIKFTPVLNYAGELASFTLLLTMASETAFGITTDRETDDDSGKLDKTFLANLFHELLTPVNVIVGFTSELSDSIRNPNDEQKESVEIINDNQKLLLQIMDNAVEYASIEQDDVEISVENLTFVEILDDIEDNIKKYSEFNNVDFSYGKISSSLKFETDRAKLISLLTIWNKFAIQTTSRKKIYLSAYAAENDFTFISINDERTGISKELFESLQFIYSEEESLVKQKHGISRFTVRLARKLIAVLGGTKEVVYKGGEPVEFGFKFPMTFSPEKLSGTTDVTEHEQKIEEVTAEPVIKIKKDIQEIIPDPVEDLTGKEEVIVQQPVQQPAAHVDSTSQSTTINVTVQTPPAEEAANKQEAVPEPEPLKQEPETAMAFDLKDLSCLYVEDQVDSQILFKVQMKGMRAIEFATSFEKALPIIESRHFDFIVMDINLQGEYNGLDALRAIQKMPGHENVPIIAVTAYVLPGDREKFIAAGFSGFITKPILRDKLEDILARIFT